MAIQFAGESIVKQECSYSAGGNANWCNCNGGNLAILNKNTNAFNFDIAFYF
jgi:hypothetical protein